MLDKEPKPILNREKYIIDSPVGKIPVTEVTPPILKNNTPVVIAPGWSEGSELFKDSQTVLGEKGRKSLVIDFPHLEGKVEAHPSYPTPELKKAHAFLAVIKDLINKSNIQQVDIITHSEGAIYVAIAASIAPEKFRHIIFNAPTGIIAEDKLIKLASRYAIKIIRIFNQEKDERSKKTEEGNRVSKMIRQLILGVVTYATSNPIRAFQEAKAMADFDITPLLVDLKKQGVGIVIIHHANDAIFPPQLIQATINTDHVDGLSCVTGSHNDLLFFPNKYIALAEEMLSALEKRPKKIK